MQRLESRKEVIVGGCWHYLGAVDRGGGGLIYYEGRMQRAHRVAFSCTRSRELSGVGEVIRVCGNPKCWNPEHLEESGVPDPTKEFVPFRADDVETLREKMSLIQSKGAAVDVAVPTCSECGEEVDPFDTHICREAGE